MFAKQDTDSVWLEYVRLYNDSVQEMFDFYLMLYIRNHVEQPKWDKSYANIEYMVKSR